MPKIFSICTKHNKGMPGCGCRESDPFLARPFFSLPPPPKQKNKKQTRKSACKSQMGGLDEYMIGGLVRAYSHPCLELFILLKYVGVKGECPSAPRPRI